MSDLPRKHDWPSVIGAVFLVGSTWTTLVIGWTSLDKDQEKLADAVGECKSQIRDVKDDVKQADLASIKTKLDEMIKRFDKYEDGASKDLRQIRDALARRGIIR